MAGVAANPRQPNFDSPAVTLRTNWFKIQKFSVVITLHLCVLYGYQNKTANFAFESLTDWFFITEVGSVYSAVRTEFLNNTVTSRPLMVNLLNPTGHVMHQQF